MAAFVGWARLVLLGLLLIASRVEVGAQTTVRTPPPLIIPSMSGSDLFRFYCASCHGPDGRGHGPVAVSLRMPPPDLTTLSRRHGGSFPRPDVEWYLTGDEPRPVAAHGSRDMPVWGPIFRALDPDDRTRTVRIANILDHMESLQAK
jgi:mono/diheme cytochrome c family protein